MQRATLFLLLIIPLGGPDKGKQIGMSKIEDGYYAIIRERTDTVNGQVRNTHWLNFETGWDKDPIFKSYDLDSIQDAALRNYFSPDSTNWMFSRVFYTNPHPKILFVNRNLGFLYGTNAIYMYYPYIYRTADGGKSWTLQTANELGNSGVIDERGFYMFNDKCGIIIWQQLGCNGQSYSLTKDGGETWATNSLKTGYYSCNLVSILFAPHGEVTLVYSGFYSGKDNAEVKSAVFKSTNFGDTFRELK